MSKRPILSVWTEDYQGSGIAGLVCTDKIDNTKVLFFPAAGWYSGYNNDHVNSEGRYWSSSNQSNVVMSAYDLCFNTDSIHWADYFIRHSGFPIRGVIG